MSNPIATLDFNDTFLDFDHLRASFPPETKINCDSKQPVPPFRLTFNELKAQHGSETQDKSIRVECAQSNRVQRLLGIVPRKNAIKFTPSQIEAIKSGMEPGLTMVSSRHLQSNCSFRLSVRPEQEKQTLPFKLLQISITTIQKNEHLSLLTLIKH
jgi:hypothetical protein